MLRRARRAVMIACLAAAPVAVPTATRAADPALPHVAEPARRARLYWDDGLNYELPRRLSIGDPFGDRVREVLNQTLPDYRLAGKIRLTLQGDGALFPSSGDLDLHDGLEVRRFVIGVSGVFVLGLPITYALDLELIQDQLYLTELFLGLRDLPGIGTLQVGQFKPAFTLDSATPSRSVTMMERAAAVEAFAPSEKAGVQVGSRALDDRLTWQIGWFANSTRTDSGDQSKSPTRVIGRVTWLPVADEGGRRLVHVGASGSYVYSPGDGIRYQSRPETHLAPRLVDTGSIRADNAFVLALESAVVAGPLSLQGEYVQSLVDQTHGSALSFQGLYLMGSWFLTGEHRSYDRGRGAFSWLTPRRPVSLRGGGIGAWELAARYSYLDLNDDDVHGGRMHLGTLGVNWYLTRNVRLAANYVLGDVSGGPSNGSFHALQGRVQLAF